MNNPMPCWTDSEELNRLPPDEVEEESPLTPIEQRLEWLFDEWQDAIADDDYESWYSVRMVLYGVTQCMNTYGLRLEHSRDRDVISFLGNIAFERSIDCIQRGMYEV